MFFLILLIPSVMAAYCKESEDGTCIELDECTCPGSLDTTSIAIIAILTLACCAICLSVACKAGGRRKRFVRVGPASI